MLPALLATAPRSTHRATLCSAVRLLSRAVVCASALVLAAACSTLGTDATPDNVSIDADAPASSEPQQLAWVQDKPWNTYRLPGKKATKFSKVKMDGRDAVLAVANASASMLRHPLRIPSVDLKQVRFSWKVPQLIEQADIAVREGDDSPVRIVLVFEGDRSKWSAKNSMLSELARTITGEELPYATLMYVWCNKRTPGTVTQNPRTDRIRSIVVESGSKNLNQWLDYERDIKADFERAFGEAPGALVGMALMTDSDNTRSKTRAYYGPVSMGHKLAAATAPLQQ
jgi:Protein of unknown function (DUF3047)